MLTWPGVCGTAAAFREIEWRLPEYPCAAFPPSPDIKTLVDVLFSISMASPSEPDEVFFLFTAYRAFRNNMIPSTPTRSPTINVAEATAATVDEERPRFCLVVTAA